MGDGFDKLFPTFKGRTVIGVRLCRIFLHDAQLRGRTTTSHVGWFVGVIAARALLVFERHEGLEHRRGGPFAKNPWGVVMVNLTRSRLQIPGSICKILREVIFSSESVS